MKVSRWICPVRVTTQAYSITVGTHSPPLHARRCLQWQIGIPRGSVTSLSLSFRWCYYWNWSQTSNNLELLIKLLRAPFAYLQRHKTDSLITDWLTTRKRIWTPHRGCNASDSESEGTAAKYDSFSGRESFVLTCATSDETTADPSMGNNNEGQHNGQQHFSSSPVFFFRVLNTKQIPNNVKEEQVACYRKSFGSFLTSHGDAGGWLATQTRGMKVKSPIKMLRVPKLWELTKG